MNAKALVATASDSFHYADVVLPEPGPDQLLVQTLVSGVSAGTEFAVIQKKIDWGPYPMCTGYQGVGVVQFAGPRVEGFAAGDKVYYRANRNICLPDGQKVSALAGVHCSAAVIDPAGTHGAAIVPEGIDEEAASLFVMPAVGLNGVDMANPHMGDLVAVHGCGLVGLAVVAASSLRGCRVVAIDLDENRLAVAARLGADHLIHGARQDPVEALGRLDEKGAQVVFECTGVPACIDQAIRLCRLQGKFVLQGHYGRQPVSYNFLEPHSRRLRMYYPYDDGYAPSRRAVLKQMALGALPWHETITHRIDSREAAAFYQATGQGKVKDLIGAVVRWAP